MKIICFTKNMEKYKSAYYQKDFLYELTIQNEVFFYGADFENYYINNSIEDVIAKSGFRKDEIVLLFAHSWLIDNEKLPIQFETNLKFNKIDIPKILILNKEYTRYEEKINWAKENRITYVFSHHTDTDKIEADSGIRTIFWPFAVNEKLFQPSEIPFEKRKYDLSYSGILQNKSYNTYHSDTRVKILHEIYNVWLKMFYKKKNKYKKFNIFFNFFSSKYKNFYYKRLNDIEYTDLQKESKLFLNTLSAGNLIGTRFFENMASRTVVFCEDIPIYDKVFHKELMVQFNPNISDFHDKLLYFYKNPQELESIANKAKEFVLKEHTWKKRVKDLLNIINSI